MVQKAANKAGIHKNVHVHTLRHSFATHLVENGYGVTTIQSLLGHSSSETTMVYVHLVSPNLVSVKSPIDDLQLGNGHKNFDYESKNFGAAEPLRQENNNLRI